MLPALSRDHPPVLVPVLLPGRVQPGSPSIFMPDINFHSFQYFMSVTIKKKKRKEFSAR